MDIHKPKPWHGVREFLKEYVIIVVGVLTALGAEQAVEWLHWRHQVAETRKGLSVELGTLLAWSDGRARQSVCIERRLDELATLIDGAADRGRLPPFGEPDIPTFFTWSSGVWQSAVSAQTAAHLSASDLKGYSSVYGYIDLVAEANRSESKVWTTLYGLAGPGRAFDAAEAGKYRDAISEARFLVRRFDAMGVRTHQLLDVYHIGINAERYQKIMARQAINPRICNPVVGPPPAHYGAAPLSNLAAMRANPPLPEYEERKH
jgi:hypothetical protein